MDLNSIVKLTLNLIQDFVEKSDFIDFDHKKSQKNKCGSYALDQNPRYLQSKLINQGIENSLVFFEKINCIVIKLTKIFNNHVIELKEINKQTIQMMEKLIIISNWQGAFQHTNLSVFYKRIEDINGQHENVIKNILTFGDDQLIPLVYIKIKKYKDLNQLIGFKMHKCQSLKLKFKEMIRPYISKYEFKFESLEQKNRSIPFESSENLIQKYSSKFLRDVIKNVYKHQFEIQNINQKLIMDFESLARKLYDKEIINNKLFNIQNKKQDLIEKQLIQNLQPKFLQDWMKSNFDKIISDAKIQFNCSLNPPVLVLKNENFSCDKDIDQDHLITDLTNIIDNNKFFMFRGLDQGIGSQIQNDQIQQLSLQTQIKYCKDLRRRKIYTGIHGKQIYTQNFNSGIVSPNNTIDVNQFLKDWFRNQLKLQKNELQNDQNEKVKNLIYKILKLNFKIPQQQLFAIFHIQNVYNEDKEFKPFNNQDLPHRIVQRLR